MKQRKMVLLTAVAIGAFRVLMAVGGKLVTDRISTGNEIDNTLSAEIPQDNIENMVFDYPYTISKEDEKFFSGFALTPQQTANKYGDLIKYLFGYTGHTTEPSEIKVNGGTILYLAYSQGKVAYAVGLVGEKDILQNMQCAETLMPKNDNITKKDNAIKLTEEEKENVLNIAKSDIDIIGYTKNVKEITIEDSLRPGPGRYNLCVSVSIDTDDEATDTLNLDYISDGQGNYELAHLYIN